MVRPAVQTSSPSTAEQIAASDSKTGTGYEKGIMLQSRLQLIYRIKVRGPITLSRSLGIFLGVVETRVAINGLAFSGLKFRFCRRRGDV